MLSQLVLLFLQDIIQCILSIGYDVVLYVKDDILRRRGVCSREQLAIIKSLYIR